MRPNRIHHMSADVVVTGIGVLSSFGRGVGAFTEALRNGTNGITFNSEDGLGLAARLEDVAFDDHLQGLNLDEEYLRRARNAGRRAPLSAQASIITALDAWQDAFGVARTY
ncbi:MAG: hypothetical protein GY790_21160, partial [Bacteroidetes bacterium]|nr:hypothetical protein [Bacteroidota bacterium]